MYSTWLGDRWDEEHGVGPDRLGLDSRLQPSLCFDDLNRAWVTWTNLWPNNTYDIATSFWTGSDWSEELQVNRPDSEAYDLVSRIACGGGRLWCVWTGGPNISSELSILASGWTELAGRWGPEMQVSPPDGRLHWFNDIAVDQQGTPHVVWCTHPLYAVFYSYFDGSRWVGPFPVNDTTRVTASWMADPHIAIDREGILHVCFTGATRGAMHRDIFYSRNDGSGWQPCEKVSQDSIYHERYSDIAADRPDNVWVVWDRQGEGGDDFRICAARRDSAGWSPEERLDNATAYYDHYPRVALDTCGCPWVAWNAMPEGTVGFDIFFNRYVTPSAVGQTRSRLPAATGRGLEARALALGSIRFSYELATPSSVGLDIYDRLGRRVDRIAEAQLPAGRHVTDWDGRWSNGRPAPAGAYLCRLSVGEAKEICSFVLLHD
jgi:hypothetical protein